MSRLVQSLIPHIKKFAVYMGFNPEVATKNWPLRGTYRVAPGSAPVPTFTHNFPLKRDQIADLQFQDRAVRIQREAMDVAAVTVSPLPRKDVRNIWNETRRLKRKDLGTLSDIPAHSLPRFAQVSEKQEITL